MEPGDLKQFAPGELTEDGHAASGFQLGLWSVLEPFLPVEPCVVLEHTAGPRLPPTRSTFKRQHLVRQRKAEASTHPPTCQLACRGSFDSLPDFAAWAWSGLVWSDRPDNKTLPKYMCSRLVTTSQNIGVLDFSTWNLRLSEAPDGGTGGVRGKRGWHGRI